MKVVPLPLRVEKTSSVFARRYNTHIHNTMAYKFACIHCIIYIYTFGRKSPECLVLSGLGSMGQPYIESTAILWYNAQPGVQCTAWCGYSVAMALLFIINDHSVVWALLPPSDCSDY